MLTLMLLRHAKSSWSDSGLDDRSRPLNRRGREACPLVATYMRRERLKPDLVLCSPARRARETLDRISPALDNAPAETVEELYDFGDGRALIDIVNARGGSAKSLLLVGHNPSIEGCALSLAGSGDASLREAMERKYPTGGLAVLQFKGRSWAGIGPGKGKLVAFAKPRELAGDD